MKLNSTVALTFILLVMMVGAGTVSALWGFTLGHEALKGVSQPDSNPTQKRQKENADPDTSPGLTIVSENDILFQVNQFTQANRKQKVVKVPSQTDQQNTSPTPEQDDNVVSTTSQENVTQKLPITGQDQGIVLEVVNVAQQGGSLLLEVNLKNEGIQPARFLYSFLDVKDDQGRSLSAITDGLPGELPANSEQFSGVVRIPTALLEDAQQLSLTLTDYPDQKLKLQLSEIPVVR